MRIPFLKDRWTRFFLIINLIPFAVPFKEEPWPIGNICSGLLLLTAVVLSIKGGSAPERWYRPLCVAYAAFFTLVLGRRISICMETFPNNFFNEMFLLLPQALVIVLFLLFCTGPQAFWTRVKQFLSKYGKWIVAGLYLVYFLLSWTPLLVLLAEYFSMDTLTAESKQRIAYHLFVVMAGSFLARALMWGLQYRLMKNLSGEEPKKKKSLFIKLWGKLYAGKEEEQKKAARETQGLAWCEDSYDPAIDHDPEAWAPLEETSAVLNEKESFFESEEEKVFFERYQQGEPLPLKEWKWEWKHDGYSQFDWKSQLAAAPIYTFLKGEDQMQALFKKVTESAREELEDFPPEGCYQTKAVKSFSRYYNEFSLRAALTGCAGGVQEAAFYFYCKQA